MQAVAEGHNDIIMVFFVLLWLYGLKTEKRIFASLSLAASVLIKYISAPLFFLDFLHARYISQINIKKYILQFIAAGILMLAIFGMFYRSLDFFSYLKRVRPLEGEWDDAPAFRALCKERKVVGKILEGTGFDVGNPIGYRAAKEKFAP